MDLSDKVEEKREAEIKVQLEREQQAKGFVKFVEEKWGKPEEVERWKQELFEMQQRAKGLVKFKGEWVTPREKFDREQKARGLVKFVDRHGKESWSTPKQVQEWKRIDIGLQSNFNELNPKEFEEFIADLFRRMDYNVQLLPQGSDRGGASGQISQTSYDTSNPSTDSRTYPPAETNTKLGAMPHRRIPPQLPRHLRKPYDHP